jgi:alkyldihydroxyacetonephosphate synthase
MLRLSDPPETQVAMAVGLASSRFGGLARAWLRLRGVGDDACLLLVGSAGDAFAVGETLAAARSVARGHGAVGLGRRPGEHWKRDRFRHPYLRESLLDLGYATDTFETATTWRRAADVRERIVAAISSALQAIGERVAVLCHASHPYRDGTSLYFTFFLRCAQDPDATVERWARVKRAANRALVASGATLSHHHGIGQWHAPAYPEEVGTVGRDLVAAAARRMDPDGILNPHVLLDPTDRLEA